MQVYIHVHSSVSGTVAKAIKQSMKRVLEAHFEFTENFEQAHYVIVDSVETLESIHTYEQHFIVMHKGTAPRVSHDFVTTMTISEFVVGIARVLACNDLLPELSAHYPTLEDAPRVLVIDDSYVHVRAAWEQLGPSKNLCVATTYPQALARIKDGGWDAVLTDLFLPATSELMSTDGMKYVGEQMPLGFVLALLAARKGVPHVAVVTDMGHHDHPMSAALDALSQKFSIDGSLVKFTNRHGGKGGKNWNAVLDTFFPVS